MGDLQANDVRREGSDGTRERGTPIIANRSSNGFVLFRQVVRSNSIDNTTAKLPPYTFSSDGEGDPDQVFHPSELSTVFLPNKANERRPLQSNASFPSKTCRSPSKWPPFKQRRKRVYKYSSHPLPTFSGVPSYVPRRSQLLSVPSTPIPPPSNGPTAKKGYQARGH